MYRVIVQVHKTMLPVGHGGQHACCSTLIPRWPALICWPAYSGGCACCWAALGLAPARPPPPLHEAVQHHACACRCPCRWQQQHRQRYHRRPAGAHGASTACVSVCVLVCPRLCVLACAIGQVYMDAHGRFVFLACLAGGCAHCNSAQHTRADRAFYTALTWCVETCFGATEDAELSQVVHSSLWSHWT